MSEIEIRFPGLAFADSSSGTPDEDPSPETPERKRRYHTRRNGDARRLDKIDALAAKQPRGRVARLEDKEDPTSKFGRFLPPGLRDRYEGLLQDPNFIEFRHSISILEARLTQLFERLSGSGVSDKAVRSAASQISALIKAIGKGECEDSRELQRQLREIKRALDPANDESNTWTEIRLIQEQIRKERETYSKHLAATNQTLTIAESYAFVAAVNALLDRFITDEIARQEAGVIVAGMLERKSFGGRVALPAPVDNTLAAAPLEEVIEAEFNEESP